MNSRAQCFSVWLARAQSLVMLTTVDNIFDGFLRGACGCCARAVLKHEVRARFFVTLLLCLLLMPLSLICITRVPPSQKQTLLSYETQ